MRFSLPLIALAAIATPSAAVAQAGVTEVPVRVSIENIDLTKAADRAALEERVETILRKACTVESNTRYSYGRKIIDGKCVSDARAEVMQAVSKVAATDARSSGQASAN